MNNRITKAKITKDKIIDDIGLAEILEGKAHRDHKGIKCDWIAHEDLIRAFMALTPHVAFICMLPEVQGQTLDQEPDVSNFEVHSFAIVGEDETEGITITASRILDNGLTHTFSTPILRWDNGQYPYIAELAEADYNLRNEIALYYDGKAAPKRQLEFFDENLNPDNLNLHDEGVTVSPEKPKRKKKVTKVN